MSKKGVERSHQEESDTPHSAKHSLLIHSLNCSSHLHPDRANYDKVIEVPSRWGVFESSWSRMFRHLGVNAAARDSANEFKRNERRGEVNEKTKEKNVIVKETIRKR